jgi:hypothetical protein
MYRLLRKIWRKKRSKASNRKNETSLVPVLIQKTDNSINPSVSESILKIYQELRLPVLPIYEKNSIDLSILGIF